MSIKRFPPSHKATADKGKRRMGFGEGEILPPFAYFNDSSGSGILLG